MSVFCSVLMPIQPSVDQCTQPLFSAISAFLAARQTPGQFFFRYSFHCFFICFFVVFFFFSTSSVLSPTFVLIKTYLNAHLPRELSPPCSGSAQGCHFPRYSLMIRVCSFVVPLISLRYFSYKLRRRLRILLRIRIASCTSAISFCRISVHWSSMLSRLNNAFSFLLASSGRTRSLVA